MRANNRIKFMKVLGEKNPADLLTKYMPAELMKRHMTTLNLKVMDGRAETAPEIDDIGDDDGSKESWLTTTDDQVTGWDRRFVVKKLEFSEVVEIRPIPATGAMRPCNRRTRRSAFGRWPGTRRAEDDARNRRIEPENQEQHYGESMDVHTCGIQGVSRWSDDDEPNDEECRACRKAYDKLSIDRPEAMIDIVEINDGSTPGETDYIAAGEETIGAEPCVQRIPKIAEERDDQYC